MSLCLEYPEITEFRPEAEFVNFAGDGSFEHSDVPVGYQGEGVVLSVAISSGVTEEGKGVVEAISFDAVDEWSEGRRDSIHGVEFGRLAIRGTTGVETEIPVAVKSFETSRHRASHELAASLAVPGLVGVKSFEPIAMIYTPDSTKLITGFEPNVMSLDNIEWSKELTEPLRGAIDIIRALHRAAQTLARLHAVGVVHSDAQIKNIAIDTSEGNSIRLIDLESLKRYRNSGDMRARDGMYSDVYTLVSSVLYRGLWKVSDGEDRKKAARELCLEPYLALLGHPMNKHFGPDVMSDGMRDRIMSIVDMV